MQESQGFFNAIMLSLLLVVKPLFLKDFRGLYAYFSLISAVGGAKNA
ncbi:hypothetical protein APP_03830 [Aeribacillus pallidus]|nr:hypothetical protein APP_03830 [Aeribacillus pallidus]